MARLSAHLDAHKRTHTHGLTAVAADVKAGKRAFANGVKLVGSGRAKPLNYQGNILLLVQNPTGYAISNYTPTSHVSEPIIIKSAGILTPFNTSNWDLNVDGYAYDSTDHSIYIGYMNAPRPLTTRKYELWGKTQSGALTATYGVRIYFNYIDVSNQWLFDLIWDGSVFDLTLREETSGATTTRGSGSFSAAVDQPLIWHLVVYESGDSVVAQCFAYQADNVIDHEALSFFYTVANRPQKNNPGFKFSTVITPGAQWLIRGCQVTDLPA